MGTTQLDEIRALNSAEQPELSEQREMAGRRHRPRYSAWAHAAQEFEDQVVAADADEPTIAVSARRQPGSAERVPTTPLAKSDAA